MATRFYFHDSSYAGGGTMPSGEQGAGTPSASWTGATTIRNMDGNVGSSQVGPTTTSPASTAQQRHLIRMFSSPALAAQTIAAQTWRLNVADSESNASANFWVNLVNLYVWRPSTGAKVGTIIDGSNGASQGGAEPTAISSEQTSTFTFSGSAVTCQAGDVLVLEVWAVVTQGAAMGYTLTVFYDGTTDPGTTENTATSDCASYLEAATGMEISGSLSSTLANCTMAGGGSVDAAGALSALLAAVVLAGTGTVAAAGSSGSLAAILDAAALSGQGTAEVRGTLATTLAGIIPAATGTVEARASLASMLAGVTAAGQGALEARASLAVTLAGTSLTGQGAAAAQGSLAAGLASATLAGTGSTGAVATGNLAATLAAVVLSANGLLLDDPTGNLDVTFAPIGLSGQGSVIGATSVFMSILGAGDLQLLAILGESVQYQRLGPPVEVRGVLDLAYRRTLDADLPGVANVGPAVFFRLSDLPEDPADPGIPPLIIVGETVYRVREVQKDGQGGVLLHLLVQ